MIEEVATVISIEADMAVIEVEKTSSCNSCQSKGVCGTSSLAGLFNFQSPQIKVNNSLNARTGDRVLVGIQENTLVAGSFILYIVPLLMLLLFAVAASLLEPVFPTLDQELLQTIAGLAGLAVGLFFVRQQSSRLFEGKRNAFMVKILPSQANSVSVNQLKI